MNVTESTVVGIGCLLLALLGIFYCPHWIKTALDGRDKRTAIFCMVMSVFFLAIAGILLLDIH